MTMSFAAPHIAYVISAYAISAVVLGGLVAATVVSLRSKRNRLSSLEQEGARRRRRRPTGPDEEK